LFATSVSWIGAGPARTEQYFLDDLRTRIGVHPISALRCSRCLNDHWLDFLQPRLVHLDFFAAIVLGVIQAMAALLTQQLLFAAVIG